MKGLFCLNEIYREESQVSDRRMQISYGGLAVIVLLERAIRLFEHLRGLGLKTCLLSNNKEPRVKSFAEQVKCPYIYKGGKPGAKGYKKAMETMGTDVKNTLFVGDQLFTDIWGANRLGIQTVLVRPINPKEEIQIVLKRYLEKPVLYCYRKSLEK